MNKLHSVLFPLVWIYMKIFHPWRAVGRENVPPGNAVLCGNHTTF